jgi:DNA (cytosine-5)-methyltransferase 1
MYNENDPKACAWLLELIKQGHLPEGVINGRSITDLTGASTASTSHFFAGIGGWPLALDLAGWPRSRPVWSGSCPCQPFSVAGRGRGDKDARHLWPEFLRLIKECCPPTIFGEQVASKAGREWLAGVRADLEALGYAVGAADLCAAGEGSPHIRQRLYWVADAQRGTTERHGHQLAEPQGGVQGTAQERERVWYDSWDGSESRWLADATGKQEHEEQQGPTAVEAGRRAVQPCRCGVAGGMAQSQGQQHDGRGDTRRGRGEPTDHSGMGDPDQQRLQRQQQRGDGPGERVVGASSVGPWDSFDLVPCADGKARRVESGTFPLAHGVPARVGRLRGYGNAIVPQVAATFVRAFLEAESA